MSYIVPDDSTAKYASSSTVAGTNWGGAQPPTTWMPLDIEAIQRLYGATSGGPLSGGQVFGYHTNITGAVAPFFDFTQNTKPIITLYDSGASNTLDLSGVTTSATIDLRDGHFSSFDGLVNNLAIAFGTLIDTAIGGSGPNAFHVNAGSDTIVGFGSSNAVYFDDPYSSYTVSENGYDATVRFGSVVDGLSDVQSLVFSDQTIALSCFAAGTPILTPTGECPVERLRPGDLAVLVLPSAPLGRRLQVDVACLAAEQAPIASAA